MSFQGGNKMYYFLAHYINMETNAEITRKIEVDGQFFNTEKEIYLYVMSKAYNMMEENECFSNLEFVAC